MLGCLAATTHSYYNERLQWSAYGLSEHDNTHSGNNTRAQPEMKPHSAVRAQFSVRDGGDTTSADGVHGIWLRAAQMIRRADAFEQRRNGLVFLNASVVQHVLAPFLHDGDLNSMSVLCRTLHKSVQPALARRKWWTVPADVGWPRGFRLIVHRATQADLLELAALMHVTHIYADDDDMACLQILKDMPHLRHLSLSHSDSLQDGDLEHLGRVARRLHILDVSMCSRLTDAGLEHLQNMTQLRHLDLRNCARFTDAGLLYLKNLLQLQHLNLRCSNITDAGLMHLKNLPQLQYLDLLQCRITDAGLIHLKKLSQLQHLDLTHCSEITDAGLMHLKSLTQLRHLKLANSDITDLGLAHLQSVSGLQHLNLFHCRNITDAGLVHLKGMIQLQQLKLGYNLQISDAGLAHLKDLTTLQRLDLSSCGIAGSGLAHLKDMTRLQRLGIVSCAQITDADLVHLKDMTQLQHLDLSHCEQLTDAGLEHLKNLRRLVYLDLQGCDVTDAGVERLRENMSEEMTRLRALLTVDRRRPLRWSPMHNSWRRV